MSSTNNFTLEKFLATPYWVGALLWEGGQKYGSGKAGAEPLPAFPDYLFHSGVYPLIREGVTQV